MREKSPKKDRCHNVGDGRTAAGQHGRRILEGLSAQDNDGFVSPFRLCVLD
jgi:hypothetical protein